MGCYVALLRSVVYFCDFYPNFRLLAFSNRIHRDVRFDWEFYTLGERIILGKHFFLFRCSPPMRKKVAFLFSFTSLASTARFSLQVPLRVMPPRPRIPLPRLRPSPSLPLTSSSPRSFASSPGSGSSTSPPPPPPPASTPSRRSIVDITLIGIGGASLTGYLLYRMNEGKNHKDDSSGLIGREGERNAFTIPVLEQ